MGKIIFITGGARSGKSRYGEKRAADSDTSVTYIATAVPFDDEMRDRIAKHKASRPAEWQTIEAYRNIGDILRNLDGTVLLDCITVMLTNLMMEMPIDWDHPATEQVDYAETQVQTQIRDLLEAGKKRSGESILVSNELGMGLVPMTPFGRAFRDIAGRCNQRIAGYADEVYLLVSGIPVRIK